MIVNKAGIAAAIRAQAIDVRDFSESHLSRYRDLVPTIFVGQMTPRTYYVGWNFQPDSLAVGDPIDMSGLSNDFIAGSVYKAA